MPQDSPYNDDGSIDWSYFNRPAIPGSVYSGSNYDQVIPLSDAQAQGYGSESDEQKRIYFNDTFSQNIPTEKPFLNPSLPLDQQTPNYGDLVPTPPVAVPSPNPDESGGWGTDYSTTPDLSRSHAEDTNVNSEANVATAGMDWSSFYDKFLSNMPPFSLFPNGTLFEFGQGLFGGGDQQPDSPEQSLGQNLSNTFDLFSNPLILMVLIMGMTGRGGSSMSSLLPLLILLPMLSGQNIQGGQTV